MDDPQLRLRTTVAALYEAYPYPPVGLFSGLVQRITQRVRWEERQTLNYQALYGAAFGSAVGMASRPRLLIAGCGTIEPIAVALANPNAEIVAVDLSARSIQLLQRQARLHGLGHRIFALPADLLQLPDSLGQFDLVIATGVLHHLPDPAAGLSALMARAHDRGVFRFMVYSAWGRSLLYATKRLAQELGITKPRPLRRLVESLPPAHPYRVFFHLYGDTATDTGLLDGYLHPCDQAFTASGLRALLDTAGLQATRFLHGAEGQPEAAGKIPGLPAAADDWCRLTLLEAFGELQENFRFVARRASAPILPAAKIWAWNEALPRRGKLFCPILGKAVQFDRSFPVSFLSEARREELSRGFFLVPQAEPT